MAVDKDRIWRKVRNKKNVVGHSGELRRKVTGGKEGRGWAFRVYVKTKEKPECLSERDMIPPQIDGVPTDVVEIGEMTALSNPKASYDPTPAGVSAIYEGGSACTLGYFAHDKLDGKLVIIANNHCTCGCDKLKPGHPYVHTSPYDKDHGTVRVIGHLKRFVPLRSGEFHPNPVIRVLLRLLCTFIPDVCGVEATPVDLGIIEPVEDFEPLLEILDIGKCRGKKRAVMGLGVEKVGRTTGHTNNGIIIDTEYFGYVNYGERDVYCGPCGLVEGYKFSAGGDSSSAIRDVGDKSFLGLLFAGSNTHTLFSHCHLIEEYGNVEVI